MEFFKFWATKFLNSGLQNIEGSKNRTPKKKLTKFPRGKNITLTQKYTLRIGAHLESRNALCIEGALELDLLQYSIAHFGVKHVTIRIKHGDKRAINIARNIFCRVALNAKLFTYGHLGAWALNLVPWDPWPFHLDPWPFHMGACPLHLGAWHAPGCTWHAPG